MQSRGIVKNERHDRLQTLNDGGKIAKSKTVKSLLEKKDNPGITPATRLAAAALEHSVSHGDGHGHGLVCHTHSRDPERGEKNAKGPSYDAEGEEESEERRFEVKWDGPDDAMNPKNMANARKWVVVFIVSAGSTCV